MQKSKEGLASEIQVLKNKLKNSRDQNSVLSDQLLLLQKECKNLLNSISMYEESSHRQASQISRLSEKNSQLKKKLRQSIAACSDIKKQAENYISSIQARFYEQMSRFNTFVNNKKDSEEIETSYSFNSLQAGSHFTCDSPAISVSERENDSMITDSDEIIMAYTQEIKEKQTEISLLNRNLEQKALDYESIKGTFLGLKENYERKLNDKEKTVANLQQEIMILNEELALHNKLHEGLTEGKQGEKTGKGEDYCAQIEILQGKVTSQARKLDNYIRTIANLEKQAQLQMVKYSELENSSKAASENFEYLENEKHQLLAVIEQAENRISELEMLKIQQAKVINEQSAKISMSKVPEEQTAAVQFLKEKVENLEEDNKKLLEANSFIQNYAEQLKITDSLTISKVQKELERTKEDFEEILTEKEREIRVLTGSIEECEKFHQYLFEEFKENSLSGVLEKLKDLNPSIIVLNCICEELSESNFTDAIDRLKNIISEKVLIDTYLTEFSVPGETIPSKLAALSQLFNSKPDFSLPKSSEIKEFITRVLKNYSSNTLSLITKISNSTHRLNGKIMNLMEKLKNKPVSGHIVSHFIESQIKDYEITTVNECSELDDSLSEDLDLKVEMSARRIQELLEEINLLKEKLENKDEFLHSLMGKTENLQKDKERKVKECSQLEVRIAELENEMKTSQERFEIADKKRTSTIFSLESRITAMKKDYEALKSSIVSEKDELFDHIIRIEQEGKTQITW